MAGIYNNLKCKNEILNKIFNPTPHQQYVFNYFKRSPYKGLLLYHKLGSGKTCTSIMIADNMIKTNTIQHVFVLTPGSLRSNWIEEYCKTCGLKYLSKKYTFITYNYNVSTKLKTLNFNNSLIIIDEAHNLINSVKNKTKTALAIYDKIINSNCRVLALSGTPIISDIDIEWSYLLKILNPNAQAFDDKDLKGIISYFPGNPNYYPTVYYHEPIKVILNNEHIKHYKTIERAEYIRGLRPPSNKMKITDPEKYHKKMVDYIKAKKYIATRRISNFDYITLMKYKNDDVPTIISKEDLPPENLSDNPLEDDEDINYYDWPDTFEENGGWISDKFFINNPKILLTLSPKFVALIISILLNFNSKHVVYTFYKSRSGVALLHNLFKKCGISSEIFSGDLTDVTRNLILKKFNNVNNRNGEKIKVLLVTDAGAEGITLLEVNNFHVLESAPKEHKVKQAIGRVIRYKSHYLMPKNRQYVNVFRYWSFDPEGGHMIDEQLYLKGQNQEKILNDFFDKLILYSIENGVTIQ